MPESAPCRAEEEGADDDEPAPDDGPEEDSAAEVPCDPVLPPAELDNLIEEEVIADDEEEEYTPPDVELDGATDEEVNTPDEAEADEPRDDVTLLDEKPGNDVEADTPDDDDRVPAEDEDGPLEPPGPDELVPSVEPDAEEEDRADVGADDPFRLLPVDVPLLQAALPSALDESAEADESPDVAAAEETWPPPEDEDPGSWLHAPSTQDSDGGQSASVLQAGDEEHPFSRTPANNSMKPTRPARATSDLP